MKLWSLTFCYLNTLNLPNLTKFKAPGRGQTPKEIHYAFEVTHVAQVQKSDQIFSPKGLVRPHQNDPDHSLGKKWAFHEVSII